MEHALLHRTMILAMPLGVKPRAYLTPTITWAITTLKQSQTQYCALFSELKSIYKYRHIHFIKHIQKEHGWCIFHHKSYVGFSMTNSWHRISIILSCAIEKQIGAHQRQCYNLIWPVKVWLMPNGSYFKMVLSIKQDQLNDFTRKWLWLVLYNITHVCGSGRLPFCTH